MDWRAAPAQALKAMDEGWGAAPAMAVRGMVAAWAAAQMQTVRAQAAKAVVLARAAAMGFVSQADVAAAFGSMRVELLRAVAVVAAVNQPQP